MQNVLVTGGAGFIGSHVAKWLVKAGYRVVVLDDLSGGFVENIPAGAEFVKGSVQDAALVDSLFEKEKFTYVFHLAAYAAEGLSHFIKNFNYQNNLVGSVNLVNAAVNVGTVKCFVFTSSIAVYGRNQTPMVEDLVPQPEDPYGISKYAMELDLKESKEMFGLNYVIFRPHNVYGEHQNIGDPYRNVIGIFMRQILTDKPPTIFGVTGGVMEAALRTAYCLITGEAQPPSIDFKEVRGMEGVKTATIDIKGTKVNIAVAYQMGNVEKVLNMIREDRKNGVKPRFDFIEVMACRGGCIGGGGQPCLATDAVRAKRTAGIYTDDEKCTLRMSHLNPEVKELYDSFLDGKTGAQGGEKAHHLLHTGYKKIDVYKFA